MGLFQKFLSLFGRKSAKKTAVDTAKNVVVAGLSGKVIKQGYIDANILNIRSEPKKGQNIIGKLSRGAMINVLGETKNGWTHFKYNGKDAYVFSKFVSYPTGKITANELNVRYKPSLNADVIGKLHRNDRVPILQKLPDWYKIDYKGKEAYAFAKFVVKVKSGSSNGGTKPAVSGTFLKDNHKLLRTRIEPKQKIIVPTDKGREAKITAQTYNRFGGLLEVLSKEIGIDIATAIAVLSVESGGKGFGKKGKVLIRFENHLFHSFWGKYHESTFNKHFRFSSSQRWKNHYFRKDTKSPWEAFHGNQEKEWEVLNFARKLDNEKALRSASYGAPQVIGSNHKVLGYSSAQALLDNFEKDIRFHIIGLFDFFNPQMIKHLQRKEFTSFARYYNGKGQEVRYGGFIKRHYQAFKKLRK